MPLFAKEHLSRNLLILLSLIILVLGGILTYTQLQKSEPEVALHPPDFRKVYWGMSRGQVIAVEGGTDIGLGFVAGIRVWCSDKTIQGLPCDIYYGFNGYKLINATIQFKQTNAGMSIEACDRVQANLEKKYGEPDYQKQETKDTFKSSWDHGNTRVSHIFTNTGTKHQIIYESLENIKQIDTGDI